jgi:hypothetical protein
MLYLQGGREFDRSETGSIVDFRRPGDYELLIE